MNVIWNFLADSKLISTRQHQNGNSLGLAPGINPLVTAVAETSATPKGFLIHSAWEFVCHVFYLNVCVHIFLCDLYSNSSSWICGHVIFGGFTCTCTILMSLYPHVHACMCAELLIFYTSVFHQLQYIGTEELIRIFISASDCGSQHNKYWAYFCLMFLAWL